MSDADCERLADELLAVVAAIRRTSRRHTGQPAELGSLTGAQLEFVRLVGNRPGMRVNDLAQELQLAPNTVSTLVAQMTRVGLVVRTVDPSDRRVGRLELSDDIVAKVSAWRDRRVSALGNAIGSLSDGERRHLSETVPVLKTIADQYARGARE